MSINKNIQIGSLIDNTTTNNQFSTYPSMDYRYGPYKSVEEALSLLQPEIRCIGLTIGVLQENEITEYWFNGGIEDTNLIFKRGKIIWNGENLTDLIGKKQFITVNGLEAIGTVDTSELNIPCVCCVITPQEDIFYKWDGITWQRLNTDTSSSIDNLYTLKCINNLPSLFFQVDLDTSCYLKFTFTSVDTQNISTNESGVCKIYLKNKDYDIFTPVESFNVQSNEEIIHDVYKYLSSGSNNIMIRVTGDVSHETSFALFYSVYLRIYKLDLQVIKGSQIYRDGQGFVAMLKATVYLGNDDVTSTYNTSQFVWSRDSENELGDPNWAITHQNVGNIIDITTNDLVGVTTIIVDLYESNGIQTLTNSINF